MKKILFLFLTVVTINIVVIAQPSVSQIKADIKNVFPKAILIDVSASGKTTKEVENNVLQTIHRQNVNITIPANNSKFPNAKWVFRGAAKYNKTGGSFAFIKYNPGDEILEGMPAPNKTEILSFLNSHKTKIFRNKYDYIKEPTDFELVPNFSMVWLDFDRIMIQATAQYEKITSNIESKSIKEKFKIIIYGKDGRNWNNAITTGGKDFDSETILNTKKYTSEELKNIKTWGEEEELAEALLIWKSIKELNVPNFNSVYEAANFVNDIMLNGDEMKVNSMLYYMSPKSFFKAPEYKVFTQFGREYYNKMTSAILLGNNLYKDQYCPIIDVKESTDASVDVYNKDKSSYCRFEFGIGIDDGKWKITNTIINIMRDEKGTALKNMSCTKTQLTTVERGTQNIPNSYKPKDVVLAYYESDKMWYPSYYMSYENYYYSVLYFIDNSKGKVRKIIPLKLEVGDKAFVKTQSGTLSEVTIKSINNLDVTIDFNGQATNYKVSGLIFK